MSNFLFLFGQMSAHTLFCLFFHVDAVHYILVSRRMLSIVDDFDTLVHSCVVPLTLAVLPQSGGFKGE